MTAKRKFRSGRTPSPLSKPSLSTAQNNDEIDDLGLFPIVGIGASAGGLEAFIQLLNHLPIDTGMAFVLVQHLDPTQKSLLTEILSRTTEMVVHEVQDRMVVEPNQVYVIPPNTTMTIVKGILELLPRQQGHKVSMCIDGFLSSLAADRGSKAIGVILSGGDSDGSIGLAEIKAAGGITFAQSKDSAQVNNMPNIAIASGHVDFILPPAEIAVKLGYISRHPYIASVQSVTQQPEVHEEKDALSTIFRLLRTATRVDFTRYKHTTIKRRISRRMALYRLEHYDDYVRYLQENPAELLSLYQEILINVTSFFRDAPTFERLAHKIFPKLLQDRASDAPIRVWVAGCSTGEEAYSLAICLLEFLAHQHYRPAIQIFATDINDLAIDKARLGIYQPNQLLGVSPERLHMFFNKIEGGYQIKKTVRELCIFARQNLISDPPFSQMDLISCRNVFIYFGALLQKKVLSVFHYGLVPKGFLLLGTSETVSEAPNLFTLVDRNFKIYTKQFATPQLNLDLIPSNIPVEVPPLLPQLRDASHYELELYRAADRIVLQKYAPAGVVVNTQLEILQFRGQTNAYLEISPGRASLNLLSMAKDYLRLELRTLIHQVKREEKVMRKEIFIPQADIDFTNGLEPGLVCQVCIDVIPFKPAATSDDYLLVLFSEHLLPDIEVAPIGSAQSAARGSRVGNEQQENQRLRQELDNTKVYLQSIIEEQQSTNQDLRVANEEILSSNEELQSTNEELQTAKEEIQATNEELSTINDELYRRNSETTQISNDFQNLLGSINIPILMLDADLRIRRFTATAGNIFNLIPTDIGRPLSDIKHNLNLTDLDALILRVIDTLQLQTQEVQDREGHWYDLRILPYRTLDNRIDGAVVVVVDIDILKRSIEQMQASQGYAEAIIQTVHDSLLVLDADFRVTMANQRFYNAFQVAPSETEHCSIFDLGNGQWNIPQLRLLLENLLPHQTQIENFVVEHEFEHIGFKKMLFNARQLHVKTGEQSILLVIEDVGEPSN